jgi:branched-chain amino acid transport system substrate-binding protein
MRKSLVIALLAGALLPASAANAQVSDDAVRIGVLTDQSSAYSDITGAGSIAAAQLAVDDFGGIVLGKRIQLVNADHQGKPDVAATIARRWFDVDGVDAIVDLPSSPIALAVHNIAKEKGRVTIVGSSTADVLTGEQCSPTGANWTWDAYSLGKSLASSLTKNNESWFFITVDFAGGHALENTVAGFAVAAGGKKVGAVRHPFNNSDFSSYLLQAQASKAQYIALANAGADTVNTIKQAREFGIIQRGQKMAAIILYLSDIKALGLEATQGMLANTAFYWDKDDDTRAWSKRFFDKQKRMPNDVHAGVYSATRHYLAAIRDAGTDDGKTVMAKMRDTPVNDAFTKNGVLRKDGRMVHDMYLVQVKSPAESKGEWDLAKIVATIPGDQAFRPLSESKCPLATP